MKTMQIALLAFLLTSNALFLIMRGNAAGECGKTPIPAAAASMAPCLGVATNPRARVTPPCCSKVAALIRTAPRCLCAVLLSPLARNAGLNPGIAIAIPKRCNIRNRPIGKKCGRYTVP